MPIRKYRSVEEMNETRREAWCDEPDAAYFKRVAELWETSSILNPRTFPTGVFRFRSLEEAQAHRDLVLTAHVRRLWRERVEGGGVKIVQQGRARRPSRAD